MTLTPIIETHIFRDDQGNAWVKRAGVKVREVIESLQAYGGDPAEFVRHFPHLTLAETYAALAHYYDHREEIDAAINDGRNFADQLRAKSPESPITQRLRQSGDLK